MLASVQVVLPVATKTTRSLLMFFDEWISEALTVLLELTIANRLVVHNLIPPKLPALN